MEWVPLTGAIGAPRLPGSAEMSLGGRWSASKALLGRPFDVGVVLGDQLLHRARHRLFEDYVHDRCGYGLRSRLARRSYCAIPWDRAATSHFSAVSHRRPGSGSSNGQYSPNPTGQTMTSSRSPTERGSCRWATSRRSVQRICRTLVRIGSPGPSSRTSAWLGAESSCSRRATCVDNDVTDRSRSVCAPTQKYGARHVLPNRQVVRVREGDPEGALPGCHHVRSDWRPRFRHGPRLATSSRAATQRRAPRS